VWGPLQGPTEGCSPLDFTVEPTREVEDIARCKCGGWEWTRRTVTEVRKDQGSSSRIAGGGADQEKPYERRTKTCSGRWRTSAMWRISEGEEESMRVDDTVGRP